MTTVIMFKLKHSASLSAGMPQEGEIVSLQSGNRHGSGRFAVFIHTESFSAFFFTSLTLLSALPCSAHGRSLP